MSIAPEAMLAEDAAVRLGLTLSELSSARRRGSIAAIEVRPGAYRYELAEVERYAAALARRRAQAAQGGRR